jgi:hypothetical protein
MRTRAAESDDDVFCTGMGRRAATLPVRSSEAKT